MTWLIENDLFVGEEIRVMNFQWSGSPSTKLISSGTIYHEINSNWGCCKLKNKQGKKNDFFGSFISFLHVDEKIKTAVIYGSQMDYKN